MSTSNGFNKRQRSQVLPEGVTETGGEQFDPDEKAVFFLAADLASVRVIGDSHSHWLIAVNELNTAEQERELETYLDQGYRVLIDSGIYNMTMEHARKHEMTMDECLALAPDEIDGFDALFERYVRIVSKIGSMSWGYIEMDQGGMENKKKTREKLEALGLHPIPVYHPLNDGWDYFDELASKYDRICFGNVVKADRQTRERLVATAWERRRKYPYLWIHLLGLTPNPWLHAFPINSGDSSTWLSAVRWSGYKPRVMGAPFGELEKNFQYVLGGDPNSEAGYWKARHLSAWGCHIQQANWRHYLTRLEEMGFDRFGAIGE